MNKDVFVAVRLVSANLCLEHPRRSSSSWCNVFLPTEKSALFHIIALQECLDNEGENLATEIQLFLGAKGLNYVLIPHIDVSGTDNSDGDQCLLVETSFFNDYMSNNQILNVKSVHLSNIPFIPDLLRNEQIHETNVYEESRAARNEELLKCVQNMEQEENVIFAGDFNEPSHLDKRAINYYCSNEMKRLGYHDLIYCFTENPMHHCNHTWPVDLYSEPKERIDFVYFRGNRIRPVSFKYLVTGLSDHLALVAEFSLRIT